MNDQKNNSQLVPGMVRLFKALHEVIMSVNANALYVRLLCIFNDYQWEESVTVSDAQMKAFTGLSHRAINTAREELVKLGLIAYEKILAGRFSTVRYHLVLDDAKETAESATTSATSKPSVPSTQSSTPSPMKSSTESSMKSSMTPSMLSSTLSSTLLYSNIEPKNTSFKREDKDIDKEKDKKEDKEEKVSLSSLCERMLMRRQWVETFCANNGMSEEDVRSEIHTFVCFLQNSGVQQKDLGDAIRHFAAWHAKRADAARLQQEAERKARERAANARRQEQLEEAERKRRVQEEYERQCQDFMKELRAKAAAGDKYAQEVLERDYSSVAVGRRKNK